MAQPENFAQANNVLGRPANMTEEQCGGLPCLHYWDVNGFPKVLSFWKFSEEELSEVLKNGGVYVSQLGMTVAPFSVSATFPEGNIAEIINPRPKAEEPK